MVESEIDTSRIYSFQSIIDLINEVEEPTMQGLAVEYSKIGLSVFPCNADKRPIVDHSMGFTRGFNDATTNIKRIASTWHKHKSARIGLSIPADLIVIDCDVEKDSQKNPVLYNGEPNIIGLKSFQKLVLDCNISGYYLNTLSVKTQSGGRHFYYRMPDCISSFSHTRAMEGLDLKGYGGYVILPNSQGQYGRYEFLNLTDIKPIPEPLLDWILKFNNSTDVFKPLPSGTAKIDREEVVRILEPYWAKADGRRNDLTLAIAGFIARSGGTEDDAVYIINELAKRTLKGSDHVPGARYSFHRNWKIKGFTTLKQLMEDLGND